MFERIIQFLQVNNWKYQEEQNKSTVIFGIQANFGTIDCYLHVSDDNGLVSIILFCMFEIYDEKKQDFIEFTNLLNFGLFTGVFEYDEIKNCIRFRTNFFYEKNNPISYVLLQRYILSNLMTVDYYFPAMMSLLFTDISPKQAINEIERLPLISFN